MRHKYVYNTLLWDKLLDHKLKYPQCAPKYKDFGTEKKYQVEKAIVEDLPQVPDKVKRELLDGVELDRVPINIHKVGMHSVDFGSHNDRQNYNMD